MVERRTVGDWAAGGPSVPSWRPIYASQGARWPIVLGPERSPAARISPFKNERGPRQKRPPYPALARPWGVGEPKASGVGETERRVVAKSRAHQPPCSPGSATWVRARERVSSSHGWPP